MIRFAFIVDIVLLCIFLRMGFESLLMWACCILALLMLFAWGNKSIYLETIDDYPEKDCITPVYFRFLFRNLEGLSSKGIPKELYYTELIAVLGFLIYTVVLTCTLLSNSPAADWIGWIYFWPFCVTLLSCGCVVLIKRFLSRYKRINRLNLKYLFLVDQQEPEIIAGPCKIIETHRCRRHYEATVRILQTGEIKERVILPKDGDRKNNGTYDLYEICNVYYVLQSQS